MYLHLGQRRLPKTSLLCAVWPLSWLGLEPVFSLPTTIKVDEVLLANGILGSVVSDYFW